MNDEQIRALMAASILASLLQKDPIRATPRSVITDLALEWTDTLLKSINLRPRQHV